MLSQLQILKQLRAEQEAKMEGGWTREEFAEAMDYKKTAATEHIKRMMQAGQVENVGQRRVPGVRQTHLVPVYKFSDKYAREIATKDRGAKAR